MNRIQHPSWISNIQLNLQIYNHVIAVFSSDQISARMAAKRDKEHNYHEYTSQLQVVFLDTYAMSICRVLLLA
jgi:hypothetical protein